MSTEMKRGNLCVTPSGKLGVGPSAFPWSRVMAASLILAVLGWTAFGASERPEAGKSSSSNPSRPAAKAVKSGIGADPFLLLFPFYRGNEQEFTGFAVANRGLFEAELEIEARRGADGQLQDYPDNPHMRLLGSNKQIARLGSDFFGLSPTAPQGDWVRVLSDSSELASFFLFGNGFSRLDGSVAFTAPSTILYFTRIHDGPQSFQTIGGPRDATTTIALANPGQSPASLSLSLFLPSSPQPVLIVERTLPALGSLRESVTSLFGAHGPIFNGFVRVEVTQGSGVVGFQFIELEDTLLGLNASFGSSGNTLYSAQLAHGTAAGGTAIFTSIKLVNVSTTSPRFVTLTAFREDGTPFTIVSQFTLQPNQVFQRDAGEVFALGPATGPAVAGTLVVTVDGPGVIGDVVFGDPDQVEYAAALPLQTGLLTRAVFSQVANAVNPNPALTTFTGLAFYYPGSGTATITISVFTEGGVLTGSAGLELSSNQRHSEVLATLVPASDGQVRGYIVVESTQPVVAQQLFGNLLLNYLSAVPPTIFE